MSAEDGEEQKLLGNVFHLISQPMTALQCSLEFALNTLDDPGQCRSWIEAALENSERLRCRLALAREVAEAAEPVDCADTVELRPLLGEALSELEPIYPPGAQPQLQGGDVEVSCERSRLLRAFVCLLQCLAAAGGAAPDVPELCVERRAELVEVRFSRFVLREGTSKDEVVSELAIAKDTFESAGGGMIFLCFSGNDAMVRVYLRSPQTQLELYGAAGRPERANTVIGTAAHFPQVS